MVWQKYFLNIGPTNRDLAEDSMTEFEKEIALIKRMGLKTNPLRSEYEKKVHELRGIPEKLKAEGLSEDQIARTMHKKRRELGRQYKEAAPPLLREYIYEATAAEYGDPLGPTYEMLRKEKTCRQIIESASRPIEDLDNRITLDGFQQWYLMDKNRLSNEANPISQDLWG